jgi:hypothetical protein
MRAVYARLADDEKRKVPRKHLGLPPGPAATAERTESDGYGRTPQLVSSHGERKHSRRLPTATAGALMGNDRPIRLARLLLRACAT